MTGPTGLSPVSLEHSRPVPLARQQGELDVETVFIDGPAPSGDCRPIRYFTVLKCRSSSSAACL